MNTDDRIWDVVVIGGGGAGLSAALMLSRVRRLVLVIDAGEPRNAPAVRVGAHNILGREGISPLELLHLGREEVVSYSGVVTSGRVAHVERDGEQFIVTTGDGRRAHARRVLVTTGLVDELPDIPGLAERWGHDAIHCVYCHGWEARDTKVGVLGNFYQALLFRQMTDRVALFAHHAKADLTDEQWEQLAALGISVIHGEVTALEIDAEHDKLTGARLDTGIVIPVDTLVVAPRFIARGGFLDALGLTLTEHPAVPGVQVAVDAAGFTGVQGVWAAGNVSDVLAAVPQAAAAGGTAAGAINMDLILEDARRAAAARETLPPTAFSGAMEAEVSRRVLGTRAHGLDSQE
ncbi:NAD(P)/FAD-dependent oxidoreductase [Streptomyces sp. GbtcB6]|uniref:NAD(P)/FAD-dependent oxidoreductase n=1 Tax=Streptomyces sp. GbtcB6 TaxID=2824751 RepID=UPI001C304799|nr:NAD(P)/FAD-dependent oxidoreductase [Streptomyces sp. GbtcB6]